ncbi:MAG: [NiFe]-hydrogenase assembly chaperone HybE [Magnetococcales bacterium]|nr:[NiFe]-hydrogenase assembly chaperone HybE [Magnetococcales bacterium]
MNNDSPRWECRWPDPVGLKVACERILQSRPADDPTLNRRMNIRVQMENSFPNAPIPALLVTPWAVERVFWHDMSRPEPPIRHAMPLTADPDGRVAAGQGVLLEYPNRLVPVLTAWEPEVGHHFIEILMNSTRDLDSFEEAIAVVSGKKATSRANQSVADHLNKSISRRNLLGLFG